MLRLLSNNNGATAIEYALIAGLISVIIIIAVDNISNNMKKTYSTINSSVTSATSTL